MNQQPPRPFYGQPPQWGQPQQPSQPPYGQPLPQQALQFTTSDQNTTSVKTRGTIIAIVVFLSIFGIFQISSHQNSSLGTSQNSIPSPVVENVGGTITINDVSCTL